MTHQPDDHIAELERRLDTGESYEAQRKAGKIATDSKAPYVHVRWQPKSLRPGCYWPGGGVPGSSAHRLEP